MPSIDSGHDGKEGEENEADDNEKDSIEQTSSSDEDESMDEEDSDMTRTDLADDISHLEKQFQDLKDQLYKERLQDIENQLHEVQNETSLLFTQQLKDLDGARTVRVQIADTLRAFKHKSLTNRCDCELQQSRQHLENERRSLLDNMRSTYEERLQRAEEDCQQLEYSTDSWGDPRPQKRQRRGEGMPEKRRKTTVTGPVIIYMLPEMEIIEDWAKIRRASLKSRPKTSSSSGATSPLRVNGGGLSHAKSLSNTPLANGHYEDGKLFFQDDWYLRGSKIVVKDHKKAVNTLATITSISPSEVSLSYGDGAKSKLSITQLQRGRTSIAFQE